MKVYRSIEEFPQSGLKTALAMGFFDGVHRGHAKILNRLAEFKKPGTVQTGLLIFDPHPLEILNPDAAPRLITSLEQKLKLLENFDLSFVIVQNFDEGLRSTTAEDFVEKTLAGQLGVINMVVGYDMRFGKGGAGNGDILSKTGKLFGFDVEIIPPVTIGEKIVSSTEIRKTLEDGNVGLLTEMLGRRYTIEGIIADGDKLGRRIGCPTANIKPEAGMMLPRFGVYAVRVEVEGEKHIGALNVGIRPSVKTEKPAPVVEVHIIDYNKDIYGSEMKVKFEQFIRPEKKFESLDELTAQIKKDISIAVNILGE